MFRMGWANFWKTRDWTPPAASSRCSSIDSATADGNGRSCIRALS